MNFETANRSARTDVAGRKILLCVYFALATMLYPRAGGTQAQTTNVEVWLAPADDQITPAGFQVDADFLQLFRVGSAWPRALSHISAFEMTRRYVTTAPEGTLRGIYGFLRTNGVHVAIALGAVPPRNWDLNACGNGVEGTAHRPDENVLTARRSKRLGADVKYIVMDEPLTFGHFFRGRNACQYSITELAVGVAQEIRKIRAELPGVIVIDEEAESAIAAPGELIQWLEILRGDLGEGAPRAVVFDVQWAARATPWRTVTPPLVSATLRQGYQYGIIFDGTPEDKTDEGWITTAKDNIKAWSEAVGDRPSYVVIQSWHPHPETILPETAPTTLTYLVNWYCGNLTAAKCARR